MGRRTDSVLAMRVSITTAVSGLLHSNHHSHSRTSDNMHGKSGFSKFSTTNMPAIHVQVKSSSDDIRILDIRPDEVHSRPPPSPMPPTLISLGTSESDASQSSASGSSRASSTLADSDSQLDYTDPPMTDRKSPAITVRDFAAARTHSPIPEIFDQHLALAEYEIRMREDPRITPLSGKTLHRLIELGCVTEAEASERWKKMDWNAYFAYKALGKPYPYRTMKNLSIPRKRKEREKIVKEKAQQISFYDKVREKAARGEKALVREAVRERRGLVEEALVPTSKPKYDVEQNILGRVPGLSRRKTMGTIPFYGDGEELSLNGAFRDATRQRLSSLQSDGLIVPIGA